MNSRRLTRLMGIICEIKAHPRRDPGEMCQRLDISRRQFYKDREALAKMGFTFHYSRGRLGFVLDKEITFNVSGQSLANLFALILAVRQLTQLSDFALAMGALAGLRTMVDQLPGALRDLFSDTLDQVVVADGFACRPKVLHQLMPAIAQRQRVTLILERGKDEEKTIVDPKRLFLREGTLYLETGEAGLVALSRVRRVISMPLFSA